jgi:hypothetical protein
MHVEVPNTALHLTNTDAAHSALRLPCLLSVLAADCHVRHLSCPRPLKAWLDFVTYLQAAVRHGYHIEVLLKFPLGSGLENEGRGP